MTEKSPNAIFRRMKNGECKWEGTKVNKTAGTEWMSERGRRGEREILADGRLWWKRLRQRSKEEWNNSSVLSNAGFTLDKAGIFMTSVYTISPTTIYQKCVSSRAAHYEYACTYLSHQFHWGYSFRDRQENILNCQKRLVSLIAST